MSIPANSPPAYQFGDFTLEPAQQRLTKASQQPVALTPKAFETLLCLVERSGELVTKNDLLTRVWPKVVVEEGILARNVADLRKALGDDPNAPRFIETLPKRGYRFIATVTVGHRPGATIDTLQLVSERPVHRPPENPLEAPDLNRSTQGRASLWIWTGAALAAALAAAAWLLR